MKEITLGEITTFSQGQQVSVPDQKTTYFENSDVFLRIVNYTQNSKEFRFIPKQKEKYLVSKEDIIMVRYGAVGFVGRGLEGVLANNMFKINFDKKLINSNYLYRVLWSNKVQKQLLNGSQSTSMAAINFKTVSRVKIPLPPLPEQKKIAAILDEADKLRQLNQQVLDQYDALTQSLFLDMFGNPLTNPMKWKVKQLKTLSTKVHSGTTPKGGSNVYVEKGIVFFRSQNVWRNRLEIDNVAFIDQETHDKMGKSSLKNKDILMTKTGRFNTENSSLGRAAIYLGEDDKANVNGHVYLIRLKENIVHEFVLFILTSKIYREHIRRVCVGGIDKRQLNKNHIEEFPIIYPPLELQTQFADRIKTIETQKTQAQAALTESENLFNSLLQKAFKGELTS